MRRLDDAGRAASLTLELSSGTAILHGEEIELPLREFRLLAMLASRVGEPVASDELMKAVWAQDADWTSKEDLYVLVSKLRRLIDGPTRFGGNIRNRRGFGYVLDLDPDAVHVIEPGAKQNPESRVIHLDQPDPAPAPAQTDSDPSLTTSVDLTESSDGGDKAHSARRRIAAAAGAAGLAVTLTVGSWAAGFSLSTLTGSGDRAVLSTELPNDDNQKLPLAPTPGLTDDGTETRTKTKPAKSRPKEKNSKKVAANTSPGSAQDGAPVGSSPPSSSSQGSSKGSNNQPAPADKLPPAPSSYLYHLYNEQTGDHFVTTDPGVASQHEGQGYQGGPIARVYTYAEKNTKPISTNSGTAYIFINSSAKTEPSSYLKALYYAANGKGDFFYTTSSSQASKPGWNSSVIGYVRSV